MSVCRLGKSASNLLRINRYPAFIRYQSIKKVSTSNDDDDKPIAFSRTEAAKWKAEYAREPPDERVWFASYSVIVSTTMFMLYFFILREENDIDEIIYRPLPETLKGVEDAYPHFDFYTKPDYVRYHEEKREMKKQKKNQVH